jgi:hypothetical protein
MLVFFRICQATRKSFKLPIHPPLGNIRVLSLINNFLANQIIWASKEIKLMRKDNTKILG